MFSQNDEEKVIIDYFKDDDPKELTFLDIGANDGITFSNTHQLSLSGWSGVCLDPSPMAFEKLENLYRNNNNITSLNFGISDQNCDLDLNESLNWDGRDDTPLGILSCIDPNEKNRFYGMNWRVVKCQFLTFETFLNNSSYKKFDFINIDCEGHDYTILTQIDLNSIGCRMVCIEFKDHHQIELYSEYFDKFGFIEQHRTNDNVIFCKPEYCIFTNDNYVRINLPNHEYSNIFKSRNNHEVLFRKINTILINNNFICKNIIDLGCWIGDNSIPWSRSISGIVYAIDPSSKNCDFIRKLIKINKIDNVALLEEAVSDEIKTISTDNDLHHSCFQPNDLGINKIVSTTLDTLYNAKILFDVDYIHLDVEGMEQMVIFGADNLINDNKPIITFEQHLNSDDYLGLSNHLKLKNYKVYLINETLLGCNADCRNFLALPDRIDSRDVVNIIHESLSMSNLLTII